MILRNPLKMLLSVVCGNAVALNSQSDSASPRYTSIIVSYPRSGSNFLQQVLSDNSEIKASSLYGNLSAVRAADNLKSHAISPEYLQDELSIIAGAACKQIRVIALIRDPRDVMISFYSYLLTRNGLSVSQEQFLDIDWFYVLSHSESTRVHIRRCHLTPTSIGDAYKIFVRRWLDLVSNVSSSEIISDLIISKYEDLMNNFDAEAPRLLHFIAGDKTSEKFKDKLIKTEKLVAKYSEEDRPRAQVSAWRNQVVQSRYAGLLEQVEERFKNEISFLGYD